MSILNEYIEKQTSLNFRDMRSIVANIPNADLPFELVTTRYQEALYRFLTKTTLDIKRRAYNAWRKIDYPAGNVLWGNDLDPLGGLIVLRNASDFNDEKIIKGRDAVAKHFLESQWTSDETIPFLIGSITASRNLGSTDIIERYSEFIFTAHPELVTKMLAARLASQLIYDESSFQKILLLECASGQSEGMMEIIMNRGLSLCPHLVEKHFGQFQALIGNHNLVRVLSKIKIPEANAFIESIESSTVEIRLRIKYMCRLDIERSRSLILPVNSWVFEYFDISLG